MPTDGRITAGERKIEGLLVGVLDVLTIGSPEALDTSKRRAIQNFRAVLADKNTVGIGVAEKIQGRRAVGKLALTVYVKKKTPLTRLKAAVAVPPSVPEPLSSGVALATDVVALGDLRPDARVTRKMIAPGYSISHVNASLGTLGAFVTRGRKTLLLSNSHVLAGSGKAKIGDEIIYPGTEDGGEQPADVIAKLVDFVKFKKGKSFSNRIDCAMAEPLVKVRHKLHTAIDPIGLPRGVGTAKRGMRIVKVGRTSGKTFGVVKDVHFRFILSYDGVGSVGFLDQVLCTKYSDPGDSGALVLDAKSYLAVGLHFAGASGGSVFCPIDWVLDAMKVKLITSR